MHNTSREDWAEGFEKSKPVIMGYVPLGIAFGLLLQKAGVAWYYAPIMSLVVYAGAAQFIAVGMLANEVSYSALALATFFVNLRHIFYGVSFLKSFSKIKALLKAYLIFGLSDETYSILISEQQRNKSPRSRSFYLSLTLFSHLYWVLGSFIGAICGSYIKADIGFLGFSLTALFVVLTVDMWLAERKVEPFMIALAACLLSTIIAANNFLILAMIFSVIGVLIFKNKDEIKHAI